LNFPVNINTKMLRLLRQFLAAILSLALGIPAYACAVGNRKQITSTLAPIPAGLFNYDPNDRFTAVDTYHNNGNTITSAGTADVVVTAIRVGFAYPNAFGGVGYGRSTS